MAWPGLSQGALGAVVGHLKVGGKGEGAYVAGNNLVASFITMHASRYHWSLKDELRRLGWASFVTGCTRRSCQPSKGRRRRDVLYSVHTVEQ